MSILSAGGEMDAFSPSDSAVYEDTTVGTFDSAFARCAIHVDTSLSYAECPHVGAQTDYWFHADLQFVNAGANNILFFVNNAGTEVVRIKMTGSKTAATYQFQYLLSSVWTDVGSTITINMSTRQTFDIHIDVTGGSIKLYLAGTLRLTASATLTGISDIAYARLGSPNDARWSQVIQADESTIGMRLLTRHPSGAGATSSWVGAYTEIDETVYSDADFINSATANQVSTFAQTGGAFTGYIVQAVIVSARAKCGATGPQNIRPILRVSGTDYDGGSDLALDAGYGPFQTDWETNPATTAAWVNTAIDALQPGVKSIT
jgi:hypothetical protein